MAGLRGLRALLLRPVGARSLHLLAPPVPRKPLCRGGHLLPTKSRFSLAFLYNPQSGSVALPTAVCTAWQMRKDIAGRMRPGDLSEIPISWPARRVRPALHMQCSKCKTENSESVLYCVRCHAPLKYTCPACKHRQLHGGTCEKCGVDFAKYAAMLVFSAKESAQAERAKAHGRAAIWKQIFLLPITGGLSLIKHFVGNARGE